MTFADGFLAEGRFHADRLREGFDLWAESRSAEGHDTAIHVLMLKRSASLPVQT